MTSLDTNDIGFIMGVIGLVGVVFTIYNYFRKPQISLEKKDALVDQQIRFMCESTDRRFDEMQKNFNGLLLQSNNHIHTVDTKVENLIKTIGIMSNEITKLSTIIEERIPKQVKI